MGWLLPSISAERETGASVRSITNSDIAPTRAVVSASVQLPTTSCRRDSFGRITDTTTGCDMIDSFLKLAGKPFRGLLKTVLVSLKTQRAKSEPTLYVYSLQCTSSGQPSAVHSRYRIQIRSPYTHTARFSQLLLTLVSGLWQDPNHQL